MDRHDSKPEYSFITSCIQKGITNYIKSTFTILDKKQISIFNWSNLSPILLSIKGELDYVHPDDIKLKFG